MSHLINKEPPLQDLQCLQIQLFSSLVLKELIFSKVVGSCYFNVFNLKIHVIAIKMGYTWFLEEKIHFFKN